MAQPRTDITLLLEAWQAGDERAHEELLTAVYDELRKIARRYLFNERADHSFRSVDLVNEAYLRLIDQTRVQWKNRNHFYAIAATLMRRVLADYARKRLAVKRGAQHDRISLSSAVATTKVTDLTYMLDLDKVLARLETEHPRQARVVELKLFVELTIDEIADVLDIAPATVKRDWVAAKSFLADQLRVEE